MNAKQVRAATKELTNDGYSPADILAHLTTNAGAEWPDAVSIIADTLKLTRDEIEEMEADA